MNAKRAFVVIISYDLHYFCLESNTPLKRCSSTFPVPAALVRRRRYGRGRILEALEKDYEEVGAETADGEGEEDFDEEY
jgi:hypothetical protein